MELAAVALVESGDASELSAMPIAQQLRAELHDVIPCGASALQRTAQVAPINHYLHVHSFSLLGESVIVHRSHLHRSGILDLRFKMIIFTSCSIGPVRLHAACSFALCRAR